MLDRHDQPRVENDEKLEERVLFIHEKVGTDALVEQYIEGRELYVGVLGNDRLRVLPVWEFEFGDMGEGGRNIATAKAKHDLEYQEQLGIKSGPAKDLSQELRTRIANIAKRVCRTLQMDGYSRVDFRLSADGIPYFLEANPNPEIAKVEDFAEAAPRRSVSRPADRIVTWPSSAPTRRGFNHSSLMRHPGKQRSCATGPMRPSAAQMSHGSGSRFARRDDRGEATPVATRRHYFQQLCPPAFNA